MGWFLVHSIGGDGYLTVQFRSSQKEERGCVVSCDTLLGDFL